MLRHRAGEARSYPFRSGRFFSVNGEWYFSTRESPAMGPFTDRDRAEHALGRFLERKLAGRLRGVGTS